MGERAKFFGNLLESSEMYCSLKHEDVLGCPYNKFTSREAAMLSFASALCAILSLIVGM